MINYKALFQYMRSDIISEIRSRITALGVTSIHAVDFSPGESPVVVEDPNDGNLSFILDAINVLSDIGGQKRVEFDASSCWDNIYCFAEDTPIEVLANILNWLDEHEDALKEEYLNKTNE